MGLLISSLIGSKRGFKIIRFNDRYIVMINFCLVHFDSFICAL